MAFYSESDLRKLDIDYRVAIARYDKLLIEMSRLGYGLKCRKAQEHLFHGALRRLKLIRYAIKNIYKLFPLDQISPLKEDALSNVTISLQSMSVNISGFFDNLTWMYVYEKSIQYKKITEVNFWVFVKKKLFPEKFCDYVSSTRFIKWHDAHAKQYRDTLAHRIPLYVPPYSVTDKGNIAVPIYRESILDSGKSVMFHPQIIADFNTVDEISKNYLSCVWGIKRQK